MKKSQKQTLIYLLITALVIGLIAIFSGCTASHLRWYDREGYKKCPDTSIIAETTNNNSISEEKTEYVEDIIQFFSDDLNNCESINKELSGRVADLTYQIKMKDGKITGEIISPRKQTKEYKRDTIYKEKIIQVAADCSFYQKKLKEADQKLQEAKKHLKKAGNMRLFERYISIGIISILVALALYLRFFRK